MRLCVIGLSLCFVLTGFFFAPAQQSDTLALDQRVEILSRTYASIPLYFAHWQGVGQLSLDSLYSAYLKRAIKTPDRYQFDLLMMEFIGQLNNGHSWYSDPWLYRTHGQSLGFYMAYLNNQWVVTRSRVDQLEPGTVLDKINGEPVEAWYQKFRRYINASSERSRRAKFAFHSFLFPENLTIETASGKTIRIRRGQWPWPEQGKVEGRWLKPNTIAYIRIPSFGESENESTALQLVRQYRNARALIIDLRGNGGGSTPIRLIRALQDRPFRLWSESTPVTFGLFKAYAQLYQLFKDHMPPERKELLQTLSELFSHPQFLWPATWETPDSTIFTGKLNLLVDRDCASACEDFVISFKDNHRALIVGETTQGSSGQPFILQFKDGISVAIGTKREYMPDGSPFEGVGIAPDVEVIPDIDDLRRGRDVVLERAISLSGVRQ